MLRSNFGAERYTGGLVAIDRIRSMLPNATRAYVPRCSMLRYYLCGLRDIVLLNACNALDFADHANGHS